ncbi:hypothetical protein BJY01DRAFT_216230 [Aspergillus pseudoustus]|uniref:Zn(2)-C6 fungal-type domain-containing protein n=1 Tax=Aspergillus pseudoustus TaxID=1810923 RepID=A0ABR4JSC4_9EURO
MQSARARSRRTRIACMPCRQNKIRCGMATPPCARCVRLELDCTVEPRARRSTQRDRVQQLETHVMELRQSLGGSNGSHSEAIPAAAVPSRTVSSEPALTLARPSEELVQDVVEYTIGAVALNEGQTQELYKTFFENFHPMVPFLNESMQPADCYRTCPLLFWSIISVAARRYDADNTLVYRLGPAVDDLLHTSILAGIKSLPLVQATALLGYWPLPSHRFWTNEALLYSNAAVTSAMQLGLHRPGHEQEYSFFQRVSIAQEQVNERSRTWIATVLLSFSVSRGTGLPPIVPVMEDLSSRLFIDIPDNLRDFYMVQRSSHQIVSSLAQIDPMDGLYPKLEVLEEEASRLVDEMGQKKLTFMNTLCLLYVTLYVQCMFFLPLPPETEESQQTQQDRQRRIDGLLRAYTTAASLITSAGSHENALEDLQFAPAQVPHMILVAVLVIFRVAHSSLAALVPQSLIAIGDASQTAGDRGRALCGMACFVIQRCSIQRCGEKDLSGRIVEMLRKMWRAAGSDEHFCRLEPVVKMTSRMGAGIILDTMEIWRRRYNKGDGQHPHPPPRLGHEERVNLDSNPCHTQQLPKPGTAPTASLLPDHQPVLDGSVPLLPGGDWENMDWSFSDMLCDGSEDWSLGGLL